ncbi:MAG: hypothetical protein H7X89_09465, partial [Rhizobiales bacterium]|nr:hypothetical protein [Hyphomicrobiales bacterium]
MAKAAAGWRKFAVLLLALVIVGLPINGFYVYALLVIAAVIIFTGEVRTAPRAWLAAVTIVLVAVAGQIWLAPPRIDEGHNLFLPGGPTQALKRGLPPQVYDQLAVDFDKQYPSEKVCKATEAGCWLNMGFPDRTFAFSADGIFHKSDFSRSVTQINFSDPTWLGLGFINEYRYNWYPVSDVQRASRDRRFWMGWKRWHLTMPWFQMIRLPAAYVGGELCWSGDLMWEGHGEHFSLLRGDQCRAIEPADAGRRIVGLAIKPASLAMRLTPPASVRLLQIAQGMLTVGALLGLLLTLVSVEVRRLIVPSVLVGLAAVVVALHDLSFLGGLRALDGGDDGLFYDGVGRMILQSLLSGDYTTFLIGFEKVFYYGGPALRYFRAFEHIVFGETFLGYLSLLLLLPVLVYKLFL